MRRFALLLCGVLLLPALPAIGQSSPPPIPGIVMAGLTAYQNNGLGAAFAAWLKGSPFRCTKDATAQADLLETIQARYGNYRGVEPVFTRAISPSTRVFYLVLDFDNGPVFAKFMLYGADQHWIVASFQFDTNPDVILPPAVQ